MILKILKNKVIGTKTKKIFLKNSNQIFLQNQIGSFGNYRTVYAYLYNRINIQKIFSKPKYLLKV